ncbi:uncharacterized protein LOC131157751 isoform X2 [Malania oleifera]|uniref:uncharacterized protein LOC131157751 isoform X2 n=1 Tax=Malania oleifera TaxID=397392 RepID=UPI0025AE6AAE|nr:uncharacterized protein LOC131157751 isoform X2 [Malania oleifera]
MEMNHALVVLFLGLLVGDYCSSGADLEGKSAVNTGFDPKSPLSSNKKNSSDEKMGRPKPVLDSMVKEDKVKEDENPAGKLKDGVESSLGKSNSSKQFGVKETNDVQTDKSAVSSEESKDKHGGGLKSKETSIKSAPLRKESAEGEECDSSNKCTDEKKRLVACLRVPGNESPDLSLLIQNKGKGPLSVAISAPDFVHLEKTSIQLQEKEDKKVKVSIGNGGAGSGTIILNAGDSSCVLDFRDLFGHNTRKESEYIPKLTYTSFLTRTPSIAFVFLAALLLMVSTWTCVCFRRKHFPTSGSKYQKLDMVVLPVSGGVEAQSEVNDGWDNSWGDSWDDEEAPKTPSMPVTPSLSSSGLASRRLSKEGWKD